MTEVLVLSDRLTSVTLAQYDTLYVGPHAQLIGDTPHAISSSGNLVTALIAGSVFSSGATIDFQGDNCHVLVETGGSVLGDPEFAAPAISASGGQAAISNDGTVAGYIAVVADGGEASITNTGSLQGFNGTGLGLSVGGNKVVNTGLIQGLSAGIYIYSEDGTSSASTIDNSGTISATFSSGAAISFQSGASALTDVIRNSGLITAKFGITSDTNAVDVTNSGTIAGLTTAIQLRGSAINADTITNSGTITASQYAISEILNASLSVRNTGEIDGTVRYHGTTGDTLDNAGRIVAKGTAIVEASTGNMNIANDGLISGNTGIQLASAAGTDILDNSGTIRGINCGISGAAGALDLANAGKITGNVGIIFESTVGRDTLDNTGFVRGTGSTGTAVEGSTVGLDVNNDGRIAGHAALLFASASDINTLHNTGKIVSIDDTDAIVSTGGALRIVNDGHIDGGISFSNAADLYDGSLGRVTGVVNGGAGADTLIGGNGSDTFLGGSGTDSMKGGAGDDTLEGDNSADQLDGGSGDDTFVYLHVTDSRGTGYDTITQFDADHDAFDIHTPVNALDAAVTTGALHAGSIDSDLSAALGAAQLHSHDALLFTASSGDLSGHQFLIVDANGMAGYQGGADYVIALSHAANMQDFSIDNFV